MFLPSHTHIPRANKKFPGFPVPWRGNKQRKPSLSIPEPFPFQRKVKHPKELLSVTEVSASRTRDNQTTDKRNRSPSAMGKTQRRGFAMVPRPRGRAVPLLRQRGGSCDQSVLAMGSSHLRNCFFVKCVSTFVVNDKYRVLM